MKIDSSILEIQKTLTYLLVIFLFIGSFGVASGGSQQNLNCYTESFMISNNTAQGTIETFGQDYSKIGMLPDNVFLSNPYEKNYSNNSYDLKYIKYTLINSFSNILVGTYENGISFNNYSECIEYSSSREFRGISHIISFINPILPEDLKQRIEQVIYKIHRMQSDSCYVSGFIPMVQCDYTIRLDITTDNPDNFVQIDSPGAIIRYSKIDNNTVLLRSYYQKSTSGSLSFKDLQIPNINEDSTFSIYFDGLNKTNTISYGNNYSITTPFFDFERQNLPYTDFSNGWIKFTHHIPTNGKSIDTNIIMVNQSVERNFITPLGDSKILPYGLDGPHPYETIVKGISYMNERGNKGTIWVDVKYINNETTVKYLRDLLNNESWEMGIHYSRSLSDMSLNQSYELMENEYNLVVDTIGKEPITWCSLGNKDNITHAKYAYDKFDMIWRNGETGVHGESNVGNLEDLHFEWWKAASGASLIHPVFTHRTDEETAIPYSISHSYFIDWIDSYNLNDIKLLPFGEWWYINTNTKSASFSEIWSDGNITTFNVSTNGYPSLINVDINAGMSTEVYDETIASSVEWELQDDGSILFWVEGGHTYRIIT